MAIARPLSARFHVRVVLACLMMIWVAGAEGAGADEVGESSGAADTTASAKGFNIMGFELSERQMVIGCGAGAALMLLVMFISGLGKRGGGEPPPATREEAPWRY